ncbi:MAG: protein translocase subunit SecD [Planctomycetaceae bacterium]|nr:protein translocase subunit SecD [Planctomycetaceae bacterium]
MPWSVSSLFAQAAATSSASSPLEPFVNPVIALAVIVISFFVGSSLARMLRMPDHGWKIGVCLFAVLASLAILLFGPSLKLGIDLRGGALLVYEVDQTQQKGEPVDMDKLATAITRRVNPGGQKEVTVRKYGTQGIEIIVPEQDEAEVARIERIISQTGELQFRILADANDPKGDAKAIIEKAMADPSKVKITDRQGKLLAWWAPVKPGEEKSFSGPGYAGVARRMRKIGNRDVMEILLLNDFYNVTGQYLTSARPSQDRQGRPSVNFNFNNAGGKLFGELTSSHLPVEAMNFTYKLAVVLDNELYSAPSIQSTITDSGEITGSFTTQEVNDLVNVLDAGRLPAALTKDPISKLYSGPTLGQDTIQTATFAMYVSAALVVAFMLLYYRFSGIVANIALAMNMLILFAVMLAFRAAFTLTGFAGLALTLGMAVDNNILVFERLREELDRGATVRMAIRNAFQHAGATIIDCNTTHLIAATVLYWLGSDQIRGFAITMWLGVVTSMFTSVFVARVIYDVAEKHHWLTKVKMMRWVGHTNFDFMGWFPYTLTASILVSIMAIGASYWRGENLFDIDFTGGVSVQVLFDAPQKTADVRGKLSKVSKEDELPGLAISDVQMKNEQKGLRFMINTSADMDKVKRVLNKVFGDKLARNTVSFSQPKLIATATPEKAGQPQKQQPKKESLPTGKQSRNELPTDRMLAFAGGDSLALALADPPAKPAAKAAQQPAKQQAPVTREPATTATPSAQKTPAKGADELVAPESFAGGSETLLRFKRPVNHQAAVQFVTGALEGMKLDSKTIAFDLSNPKYVEEDRTEFNEWTLKVMLAPEKAKALLDHLQKQIADVPIFPSSSTIGGVVAGNTRFLAICALVASWIGIIIYLWVRFQAVAFGFAAVVALVHDVVVMLGAVAISIYVAPYLGFLLVEPVKVNLPIVAAFLTIIGYSVNDTIVVFDRIREVRGKDPSLTRKMVNDSTNQTLSRTLLTSLTVFLVVIVLYVAAGDALHGFAFALLVGVATGTYSSVYIAAPILLWLVGKHREKSV